MIGGSDTMTLVRACHDIIIVIIHNNDNKYNRVQYKERKAIHLVDMACPREKNVLEKNKEKRQKY